MIIDELIYGVILIANIVASSNAPPENVFIIPNMVFELPSTSCFKTDESSHGTGITEPNLKTTSKRSV